MANHPQSEPLRRTHESLFIARLDTLPMAGLTFKPIHPEDLPEVAAFLHEQQEIASRDDLTQAAPDNNDLTGFQKDPDLSPGMSMGETLRDSEGKIRGMILGIPRMYRLGSQRLLGRAAGNFYVDASARLQGFFMLRRFLGAPGFDFYYANSCNRQSASLGQVRRTNGPGVGCRVSLTFQTGPACRRMGEPQEMAPGGRGRPQGRRAPRHPGGRARRPKHQFTLEYCVDLERLAVIADRNRDPELLQPERSVAYLKWVYGSMPKSPNTAEISGVMYRFADPAGREGWFVLRFEPRGHKHQIRSARLVDVVWPFQHLAFIDVLPAIIEVAKNRSDLLSIRGRVGLGIHDRSLGLRRRALLSPEGYVQSRTLPTTDLVKVADFPFADRY